ncbi:MAG: hypothetical protein M3O46_17720 [Myxococcota bacterium]|nr:hypothetical protein [Myxococcota bacterium]
MPARIATLESELARLKQERQAEADNLARMLVRIADAERARTVAEGRASELTARVRELESMREDVARGTEAMNQALHRAELAEQSASDGAAALERTREELQADRARFMNLEAKLARLRREHGEELAALRSTHAEASLQAERLLSEERSTLSRVRQQATTAEVSLASSRERVAQATSLVEEMERREEMAAAIRARALEQTRRALAGEEGVDMVGDPAPLLVSSRPSRTPQPVTKRPRQGAPPEASSAEERAFDDADTDATE